ncbi:hypothetical protein BDY21DRAFT_388313 [Lineolata rhizophorae]|uniref:DUF7924 domain-containing protein n=1 Tax=Lineolata rhizophorae TaxID=578093 RepID=A0A6A6NN90_9PEZI|nr:hypothetical protein BDY21DRAFT_388313 [Lineolata rhizophorae]
MARERPKPAQTKKAKPHRGGISKAATLRRGSRITPAENPPQQKRRSRRLQGLDPTQTTLECIRQTKTSKQPREGEASLRPISQEDEAIRDAILAIVKNDYIDCWRKTGTWPSEEPDTDRLRELINEEASPYNNERSQATQEETESSTSRTQKHGAYKNPLILRQMKDSGSFMHDHELGITAESERLCQRLLKEPQPAPQHTLFSDDALFKKTCSRIEGENETRVVRDISQFIVPSAEILADKGAKHLAVLRETTNACWTNSVPFANSRFGPRPQPDFGLGFDRYAFDPERLRKLDPLLGNLMNERTFYTATSQMYFPFLTSGVKCGHDGLEVADRQNAYAQSIVLRGLHSLFKLVGRESELHREINGFSISHNDCEVRIYGHYAVINGNDVKFYRCLISAFSFVPSAEGDQRWKAYNFVKNVYDLWLPEHFERICSVIDMLPDNLEFDVSEQDLAMPNRQPSI